MSVFVPHWWHRGCQADLRRVISTHPYRAKGGSNVWKSLKLRAFDEHSLHCSDDRYGVRLASSCPGRCTACRRRRDRNKRSEEHTSELQSLMRTSYAVFCLKKKKHKHTHNNHKHHIIHYKQ